MSLKKQTKKKVNKQTQTEIHNAPKEDTTWINEHMKVYSLKIEPIFSICMPMIYASQNRKYSENSFSISKSISQKKYTHLSDFSNDFNQIQSNQNYSRFSDDKNSIIVNTNLKKIKKSPTIKKKSTIKPKKINHKINLKEFLITEKQWIIFLENNQKEIENQIKKIKNQTKFNFSNNSSAKPKVLKSKKKSVIQSQKNLGIKPKKSIKTFSRPQTPKKKKSKFQKIKKSEIIMSNKDGIITTPTTEFNMLRSPGTSVKSFNLSNNSNINKKHNTLIDLYNDTSSFLPIINKPNENSRYISSKHKHQNKSFNHKNNSFNNLPDETEWEDLEVSLSELKDSKKSNNKILDQAIQLLTEFINKSDSSSFKKINLKYLQILEMSNNHHYQLENQLEYHKVKADTYRDKYQVGFLIYRKLYVKIEL